MSNIHSLRPVDLLLNEAWLLDRAASVCPFRSGCVTFPQELPEGMAREGQHLPVPVFEEKKLLLPLIHQGSLLGVLLLQDAELSQDPAWLRALPAYMEKCLENLQLRRQLQRDQLTGLLSQHALLEELSRDIERIGQELFSYGEDTHSHSMEQRGRIALVAIQVPGMQTIFRERGLARADHILCRLAEEVSASAPQSCQTARLENHRLALALPGYGSRSAREAAERIRSRLNSLNPYYTTAEDQPSVRVDLGLAVYPRDLEGPSLAFPPRERAGTLLAHALRAAETASSQPGEEGRLFTFSGILARGGRIKEILTGDRVVVDLGARDRARESQIFSVLDPGVDHPSPWPADRGREKGELMLIDTGMESSLAEVLHLRPGAELSPGDSLALREDRAERGAETVSRSEKREEKHPGEGAALSLPRFLQAWQRSCQTEDSFCLALCRLQDRGGEEALQKYLSRSGKQLEDILPRGSLLGSYGSACLIIYLPGTSPQQARQILEAMSGFGSGDSGSSLRAGVGYYPCLNYNRLQITETARMALEHAQLLTGDWIAVFDSLSLTVRADRHYARGDLAEAIREYEQALLLDSENQLARNSLGICYAHIGRTSRAQQEFETLLEREPDHVMALYNHACVSQKAGQLRTAEASLQRCLRAQPEQLFCLIRLGQIREQEGDPDRARQHYLRAEEAEQGEGRAAKHLARLDYQNGDLPLARSRLQSSLRANPRDGEALHLMARIYREAGEDPELVESLAQRGYRLRPDLEESTPYLRGGGKDSRNPLYPQETGSPEDNPGY